MLTNRSIPRAAVIPELAYPDLDAAAEWLSRAFGFTVRLRIGGHRIQMHAGEGGALVLVEMGSTQPGSVAGGHGLLVRVEDADAHHARAVRAGAAIVRAPEDHAYGERQYTAEDPAGRRWTFSQSIADVDPVSWGGEPGEGYQE